MVTSQLFRVALFIVALHAIAAAPIAKQASLVQNGYVTGRSASVVVQPLSGIDSLSSLMFWDVTTLSDSLPAAISQTDVSVFLSDLLGIKPLDQPSVSVRLPNAFSSVFHKKKATVLVSLAGASRDELDGAVTPNLVQSFNKFSKTDLELASYPQDEVASMVTVLTGRLPSKHGVVGRTWFSPSGERADAYDNDSHSHHGSNIVDILADTYNKQSMTLAFARDERLASATATRLSSPSALNVHFDSKKQQYVSSSDSLATLPDLQALLEKESGYDKARNTFSLPLGEERVSFDLTLKEDLAVVAEVLTLRALLDSLSQGETSTLLLDNHPDFFALTLTGLQSIKIGYGKASNKYKAALHLYDSFIPQIVAKLQTMFNGDVNIALHMLPAHPKVVEAVTSEAVKIVQSHLPVDNVAETYPSVYVDHSKSSPAALNLVNHDANKKLRPLGVEVVTIDDGFAVHEEYQRRLETVAADSAPTIGEIAGFQVSLWVSLALSIVAIAGFLYTVFMPDTKDSILEYMPKAQKSE